MIKENVVVAVQRTMDSGKCGICGETLDNDCTIYGLLRGTVECPDYYSINDVYSPDMVKDFDAGEDQRMVSFNGLDARTYCEGCYNIIIHTIESGYLG